MTFSCFMPCKKIYFSFFYKRSRLKNPIYLPYIWFGSVERRVAGLITRSGSKHISYKLSIRPGSSSQNQTLDNNELPFFFLSFFYSGFLSTFKLIFKLLKLMAVGTSNGRRFVFVNGQPFNPPCLNGTAIKQRTFLRLSLTNNLNSLHFYR